MAVVVFSTDSGLEVSGGSRGEERDQSAEERQEVGRRKAKSVWLGRGVLGTVWTLWTL